jgi:HTH-type transcriptional regulator/antitoxin HigA
MDVFPIRTDEDHARALRRIEQLWNAKPNSPEEAELDVLATLVDAYEEKRWPIEAPNPVDAIIVYMSERALTQADLAKVIGSRSRASEILNKRRHLTLEMVCALNKKWRIPAELLIKPYKLKAGKPRGALPRAAAVQATRAVSSRRRAAADRA